MKLLSVCCVLLTITITATCLQRDSRYQQVLARKSNKKLIKRDASLLIDTSPIDVDPVYRGPPIISYRRLSRSKIGSRPKQPPRLHKSVKKYKKPVKPKYGSPSNYKKKTQKPRYHRKRPSPSNSYTSPPKYSLQYAPYQAEPAGFGEPPVDFRNEYPTRQIPSYKEELIDSYGSPIKLSDHDDFPPQIHPSQFNKELEDIKPGGYSWQNFPNENSDTVYAYSKKRPIYERPEYDTQDIEDFNFNEYNYRSQRKPNYFVEPYKHAVDPYKHAVDPYKNDVDQYKNTADANKYARPPWKIKSQRGREVEDEIIVGGQYAEPPARYVPKFQPSAPMYDNDEDFAPPQRLIDPEITVSATNSPYVNYKHSNMAFSPQNLNDAFSIVEK